MSTAKPSPNDHASTAAAKAPNSSAMELMKPGPEHARLAAGVGTWNVACTAWMPGNATPSTSTGKAVITALFEGRYTREEFTGEFGGKPLLGIGTTAYDRAAKQYVYTWFDNMGTGITRTSGAAVGEKADLELRGDMTCPVNGEVQLRQVFSAVSGDRYVVTMYNSKDGQESKTLELVYTRAR